MCAGAPLPRAEADLAGFGVLQTGMLEVCDGRRQLAVDAADLCKAKQDDLNKKLDRRWYEFWK